MEWVAAAVVVILLIVVWRVVVLGRGIRAYGEARQLARRGDLSASEQQRLETLRQRARSWGDDMDPAAPPMQRLEALEPRHQWLTQNLDGTEDPAFLEAYADTMIPFAQGSGLGYSDKLYEEAMLTFARLVMTVELQRMDAAGQPRTDASREAARARTEAATRHFMSAGTNADGTWRPISPDTAARAAAARGDSQG